jgi:hypothetical protein
MNNRNDLKKWLEIFDKVLEDNKTIYSCPKDSSHLISMAIIPYVENSKVELILECSKCKIKRTLTKELEDFDLTPPLS